MNKDYWIQREALYNEQLTNTKKQLAPHYKRLRNNLNRELSTLNLTTEAGVVDQAAIIHARTVVNANLSELYYKEKPIIERALLNGYKADTILTSRAIDVRFMYDQVRANLIVNNAWAPDSLIWSERLIISNAELQQKLIDGLYDIAVRQVDSEKVVRDIASTVNATCEQKFYQAERLVRTELKAIQSQSAVEVFKQVGVEQYRFVCEDASDYCYLYNGQIFRIEDAQVGENLPPLHPNCMCSIEPIYEGL